MPKVLGTPGRVVVVAADVVVIKGLHEELEDEQSAYRGYESVEEQEVGEGSNKHRLLL